MNSTQKLTHKQFTCMPVFQHNRNRFIPLCTALLVMFVVSIALAGCGSQKEEGTVIGFGQSVPAGGGLVQSYITVQLDDGSELRAWLPQDDAVWNKMSRGAKSGNIRVEIEREKDYWMYVQILSE